MKEKYHKYIMAAFAGLIAFGIGFYMGMINGLNWIIRTAVNRFGLQIDINYAELAQAIFRYKNAIG